MGRDRSPLTVRALGPPELWIDGRRVDGEVPAKAVALIVHLADVGGEVERSTLAGLLWSGETEERARHNLRVTLSRLRAVVGERVQADRTRVRLGAGVEYDVGALAASGVVATDRPLDDFLAGFSPPGAELFDEWVAERRVGVRLQLVDALLGAARTAIDRSAGAEATTAIASLTRVDPWNERAHRLHLRHLAATAGRSSALVAHAEFAARLDAELGVEPDDETKRLVRSLRAGEDRLDPLGAAGVLAPPPLAATPFVGREAELATLSALTTAGRPLSIVGPGGVGKTRLMAEYAQRRRAEGTPTLFVAYDGYPETTGATTEQAFAEAILAALGLPADDGRSFDDALGGWAGGRRVLVCLDNLEQLRDVERCLARLVERNPSAEVVVTSRRRLLLVAGRVVELGGLDHDDRTGAAGPSAAMALFLDRASRPAATSGERATIARICAALHGHPLAIELAAHRTATSSLEELVALVESSRELATGALDVPVRHRSLTALVEASTDALSPAARRALDGAATFSGAFTRDDLAALVELGGDELQELVEHSLVAIDGDRYRLHPLIRRHVVDRPQYRRHAPVLSERHARHLLDSLALDAAAGAWGMQHQERAEDLRRATSWRIDNGPVEGLVDDLRAYLGHQRSWGWVESSLTTIDRALRRDDLDPVGRAELHRHGAEAHLHAGDPEAAMVELERGLAALGRPALDRSAVRRRADLTALTTIAAAPLRLAGRGTPSDRADAAEQARLMSMFGEVLYVTDRRAEMNSYGLGALAAGRRSRDDTLLGAGDAAVAIAARFAGVGKMADRYRRRARDRVLRSDAEPFTASFALGVTAILAISTESWTDARRDIDGAIRAARRAGRPRFLVQLGLLDAMAAYHRVADDDALARLDEVEELIERHAFRRARTWQLATRAEVELRAGVRSGSARAALEAADHDVDQARARVSLARVALADDPEEAARLVAAARPAIGRGAALAIQHFETHCGYADVVVDLADRGVVDTAVADDGLAVLARFSRAVPIAAERHRRATKRHRGSVR